MFVVRVPSVEAERQERPGVEVDASPPPMMPTKGAGMLSAGQAPPAWCGASIFNFYF